jgi:hypothetical protein
MLASQIYDVLVRTFYFNYENYSWAKVKTHTTSNAKHSSEPMTWYTGQEPELQDYGTHCPEIKDLASRSSPLRKRRISQARARRRIAAACIFSYPCPKDLGAERNDPHVHAAEAYLPLRPAINLNEAQHRRTTSFRSDYSSNFPNQSFVGISLDFGTLCDFSIMICTLLHHSWMRMS